VTGFAYDALNRLVSVTYPDSPAEDVAYGYDDASGGNFGIGRLTGVSDESGGVAFTYGPRGNLLAESRVIGAALYETAYAYDPADRLVEIVYPSGRIVNYARGELGRVVEVTTRADAFAEPLVLARGIAYLPFGPMTALDYGNGLGQSRDYDLDYRLAALATLGAGTAVQDLAYAYDPAGNVTAIGDALDAARGQSFAYGALARLTEAQGLYGEIAYSYDANGNRLSRQMTGGSQTANETYAYEAGSNRLSFVSEGGGGLRELGTDESGNIVADLRADGSDFAYSYNAGGRLAQVSLGGAPLALYLYDAFGRRALKEVAGGGLPRRSPTSKDPRSCARPSGRT
jgi:YD repeat-containing protein